MKKIVIDEVEKALKNMVESEGKLAMIVSIKKGKKELSFINANQVFVRCSHCGKITNKGAK